MADIQVEVLWISCLRSGNLSILDVETAPSLPKAHGKRWGTIPMPWVVVEEGAVSTRTIDAFRPHILQNYIQGTIGLKLVPAPLVTIGARVYRGPGGRAGNRRHSAAWRPNQIVKFRPPRGQIWPKDARRRGSPDRRAFGRASSAHAPRSPTGGLLGGLPRRRHWQDGRKSTISGPTPGAR